MIDVNPSDDADSVRPDRRRSVREEHRLMTRQRIIESAMEVFERKGYASATVEDIVAHAGIARATFYLHFKNKLSIVQAVTAEGMPDVAALYQELDVLVTSGAGCTVDSIRDWMERAVTWFETHRTISAVWQDLPSSEPEFVIAPWCFEQMPRYLSQWPEDERDAARIRVILLVQQLARTLPLSNVCQALDVENSLVIDVLSRLCLDALKPPGGLVGAAT